MPTFRANRLDVRGRAGFVAVAVACLALAPVRAGGSPPPSERDVTIVGVFAAAGPITGAVLDGDFLYVSTHVSLAIYDVADPLVPKLLAIKTSPRMIYGELISTDGEILLLNDGLGAGTLDVWNVEDKTNPVVAASVAGVRDMHVSCLLRCRWAYGSNGTVVDLRDPTEPDVRDLDWRVAAGLRKTPHHRVDEFRPGFMATAPRKGPPVVVDVRRPLEPRIVARARMPKTTPNWFLYSEWANGGRDRFLISSTENAGCNEEHQGALVTFDTKGWPGDDSFELLDTYRYRGRTDSDEDACQAYYFSLHPSFDDGGLALLPNAIEGTRIIEIDERGQIEQLDEFVLPTSNVWLAFWLDEEIFYALNQTGDVYVLRYE